MQALPGKPPYPRKVGLAPHFSNMTANDIVKVLGSNTLPDCFSRQQKRFTGNSAGFLHLFDLNCIFKLYHKLSACSGTCPTFNCLKCKTGCISHFYLTDNNFQFSGFLIICLERFGLLMIDGKAALHHFK